MRTIILIPLTFLLLLSSGRTNAEPLTWRECLIAARSSNLDLLAARERLEQTRARKSASFSGFLPDIDASSSAGTSRSSGLDRTETYTYKLTAQQLLYDGGETSQNHAAAASTLRAEEYAYQVSSADIRYNLRKAYVDLIAARQTLDVSAGIDRRRQQNLELVTLRYNAGREHKGSLLTAQANAARSAFELDRARRALAIAQRHLGNLLGHETFEPYLPEEELTVLAADPQPPVLESLVVSTPLLQKLAQLREAAKAGVISAKAALGPSVFASANLGRSGNDYHAPTRTVGGTVTASLPFFDGNSRRSALREARASLAEAEAEARGGRASVILTLARAWSEWQNAVQNASVSALFLEAAEQRAAIVEAQYRTGLATFNDWTLIEDELVNYRLSDLQAKSDALIAEAAWAQAKGVTLDED